MAASSHSWMPTAGQTTEVPTAGRIIEVIMVGRAIEKGAHTYPADRIITATKATATVTVTVTSITDSLACAIRAAAMEAGLDCQLPLTPTIGV